MSNITHDTTHRVHHETGLSIHEDAAPVDKEGQEFHPHFHTQGSLKLIKQVSTLTILLSIYQIIPNGLSTMISPSSFNIASISLTLVSLALSIALYLWADKLIDAEENKTLLTTELTDKSWKRINTTLFLSLLIRAAASPALILNMLLQTNQTREELINYGLTVGETSYITFAKGLSSLTVPLPLFEIMICVTFLTSAKICFNYFKEPGQAMSRLVLASNSIMAGTALGLLFTVFQVRHFHYPPEFAALYPSWLLNAFFGLSIAAVTLSFAVWLVNFKRWRAPSFATSIVLLPLVLSFVVLGSSSYTNTSAIEGEYGRTNSNPFLALSNFAVITGVFGALTLIGNIYLIQNPSSPNPQSKRQFKGLYILIALVLVFAVARVFYLKPYSNDSNLIVKTEHPQTTTEEQPKVQEWVLEFSDKLASLSRDLENAANSVHDTKGLLAQENTETTFLASKLAALNSQLQNAAHQVKEAKDTFLASNSKDLVPEQMINSLWTASLDDDISEYQNWLDNTQPTELYSCPVADSLANMAAQLKTNAEQLVEVSNLLKGAYNTSKGSIAQAQDQAQQAQAELVKAAAQLNSTVYSQAASQAAALNQTLSGLNATVSNLTSSVISSLGNATQNTSNLISTLTFGQVDSSGLIGK